MQRRSLPASSSRAHRACENCRRKKTRCSGGTPNCSLCARLSQQCVYADEQRPTPSRSTQGPYRESRPRESPQTRHRNDPTPFPDQSRFEAIENRLEDLTRALVSSRSSRGRIGSATEATDPPRGTDHDLMAQDGTIQHMELSSPLYAPTDSYADISIPEHTARNGVKVFFDKFQYQPCPLLSHLKGKTSTSHCLPQNLVLYPMLALVSQTSKISLSNDAEQNSILSGRLAGRSWSLLTEAYAACNYSEEYFEGLCLMAQRDFAVGNTLRARSQVALGLRIAQISGMFVSKSHVGHGHRQENRRAEIVWSLFMLDRMFLGLDTPSASLPLSSFANLAFPNIAPEHGGTVPGASSSPSIINDTSIIATIADLMGVWESVVSEISESSIHAVESWKPGSTRAKITSRLLELEIGTRHHSYTSIGSLARVRTEPHLEPYFRAWLFYQFLHSAIHCCLNHPFLIFIKMRHLQQQVPFTFLQECYRYSKVYADWIFRSVAEMEDAGLLLHEPFVGFLVAIAASIHLEHSSNANPTVAAAARSKFKKCLGFVQRLVGDWSNLRQTVSVISKLEARLQSRGTMQYVQDDFDGAQPQSGSRHVSLSESDISLMWHLFDYVKVSSQQKRIAAPNSLGASSPRFDRQEHARHGLPESSDLLGDSITVSQENGGASDANNAMRQDWEDITLGLELEANDWSLFGAPWMGYFPSN